MSEIIHVKVTNGNTLTLPLPIDKLFTNRTIPRELDIIIIDRIPQEYVEKVLGCFDFDDELISKVNQLEMDQWVTD